MTPKEYFEQKKGSSPTLAARTPNAQPRARISDEEMNRIAPATASQVSMSDSDEPSQNRPPDSSFGFWNNVTNAGKKISNLIANPLGMSGNAAGLFGSYAMQHPKETVEAGLGLVKNFAKSAIQIPQAAAGGLASLVGRPDIEEKIQKPRELPLLGEVKPLSAVPEDVKRLGAQTPGETASQAGEMYLEAGVPGAGRLVKGALKGVGKLVPLPAAEKVGEALSAVRSSILKKAANPEMAQAIKEVRELGLNESPEGALTIGEEIFGKADAKRKAAMDAYKQTKNAIVASKQGQILENAGAFRAGVEEAMKENNIRVGEKGIDLIGSQFEGSKSAQSALERVHGIMTRAAVQGMNPVDDLLTRREAISSMLDEIPLEERSLRRTVGNMRSSFDKTLEGILGPEATALRKNYAESIKPTTAILDAMTTKANGVREFSPDRAAAFINQAASEMKFDKRQMLSELDSLIGTGFAKKVEALGIDRAISQIAPATKSRVGDVLKTFAIGRLPILSTFVSPKFWGDIAIKKGLRAAEATSYAKKTSDQVLKVILTNLLTAPVRNLVEENQSTNF